MALRLWTDEYKSEVPYVDMMKKGLFDKINKFEETNNYATPGEAVLTFLKGIADSLEKHFDLESKIMDERGYPLAVHHNEMHKKIMADVDELMSEITDSPNDKEYYYEAIHVVSLWMHHVVRDDFIVFYFSKTPPISIGKEHVGRSCEVYNLDSQLLSYGIITKADAGNIEIDCKNKIFNAFTNDAVKVSFMTAENEFLCFACKVFFKDEGVLALDNRCILITANNAREAFRLPVMIMASLSSFTIDGEMVKILDISAGGIMAEAEAKLPVEEGEEVRLEFSFRDTLFVVKCAVKRFFKNGATSYRYGMEFTDFRKGSSGDLTKLLLKQQVLHIKGNRSLS